MAQQKAGHGGSKKIGRNRDKCKNYKSSKTREYNKYKRILRSNGFEEAHNYAVIHNLLV